MIGYELVRAPKNNPNKKIALKFVKMKKENNEVLQAQEISTFF